MRAIISLMLLLAAGCSSSVGVRTAPVAMREPTGTDLPEAEAESERLAEVLEEPGLTEPQPYLPANIDAPEYLPPTPVPIEFTPQRLSNPMHRYGMSDPRDRAP